MDIGFTIQHSDFQLPFSSEYCIRWLDFVAEAEKSSIHSLEYILVDDEKILNINAQFLNHHYYTDIITFNNNTPFSISGEIFISIDTMKENAAKLGVAEESEFLRLLIHGLLHLLGYNDAGREEKTMMRHKEDHYIKLFYQNFV